MAESTGGEVGRVFTPLTWDRSERLSFPMDKVTVVWGDLNRRKIGLKAVVVIEGRPYQVFGAACSSPRCRCDARIREVK